MTNNEGEVKEKAGGQLPLANAQEDDPLALQREVDEGRLTPLSQEQQARNLSVVMSRQSVGGGHLTDTRHLGEMPDYRPHGALHHEDISGQQPEQTVIARGQWV